jgi:hypothetical protein
MAGFDATAVEAALVCLVFLAVEANMLTKESEIRLKVFVIL